MAIEVLCAPSDVAASASLAAAHPEESVTASAALKAPQAPALPWTRLSIAPEVLFTVADVRREPGHEREPSQRLVAGIPAREHDCLAEIETAER